VFLTKVVKECDIGRENRFDLFGCISFERDALRNHELIKSTSITCSLLKDRHVSTVTLQ
jgi:hypothetical protein